MTESTANVVGEGASSLAIARALAVGRIVAVLRATTAEHFVAASAVLVREGIRAIEVTLTSVGGLDALRTIRNSVPDGVTVGAGSVLSASQAQEATEAGAQFLVSPVTLPDVLAAGRAAGVPTYPGALSPTEVWTAHAAGASVVKLFPASIVGPSYIRDLHGPMPDINIMPTGGISLTDVGTWLDAGALAVGLGGPLLGDALVGGCLDHLASRARQAVSAVPVSVPGGDR